MPTTTPGNITTPPLGLLTTGNVPADLLALANGVKNGIINPYSTTSARDAAITVANGAYVGQIAATASPLTHWKITGITGSTISWARLLPVVDDFNPTAIVGSNWDGVSPIDRRHFSTVGTVANTVGNTPFTFQKSGSAAPFANGIFEVTMTLGDSGIDLLTLARSLTTLSGCVGFAKYANGTYPSSGSGIRATLIVTGW